MNHDSKKIYVIKKGRSTGIFIDHEWNLHIKELVTGYPGALYKSFSNLSDAKKYWDDQHIIHLSQKKSPEVPLEALQSTASNDQDSTSLLKRKRSDDSPLRIFTDGACLYNGCVNASAGYGIYFGPNDPRNVSDKLEHQEQTNNRAELTAIIRALEITKDHDGMVEIHSDSQYCSKGITKWIHKWKVNGWKTVNGTPVKNKDLWMMMDKLYSSSQRKDRISFIWVKGHSGNAGNEQADRLANQGARI